MRTAYHTSSVALTQNYWTKCLGLDTSRKSLTLRSLHPVAGVSYQFCLFPYALDFDGTDDYGTVSGSLMTDENGLPLLDETGAPMISEDTDDFVTLLQNDTEGSIIAQIKLDAVLSTSDRCIFSTGKAGVATYLEFGVDANGYLFAKLYDTAVLQWHVVADRQLDLNWHTVKLIHNGVYPKLHVDGEETVVIDADDTDLTQWLSDLGTDLDYVDVGSCDTGSGRAHFFAGLMHSLRVNTGTGNDSECIAYWQMRDATTSTYGTMDDIGAYAITFKGTGEPAWASYEPGEYAPPGTEWNDPDMVDITAPVWALTDQANVTVRVATASKAV